MTEREIIVCRDVEELNRKAAAQFIDLARSSISRSGRFAVALSGGSTPKALYSLLASPEYRAQLDWPRIHFFWGDERCVPPDHAESNFRMTREALLDKIFVAAANVHRMPGEIEPARAAADYEVELRRFFGLSAVAVPRFDLVLLGLGEDGHTASLFPGSPAVNETERLVATAYVEKLHAHRLTLTLQVLNAAAQVTFLIAGASKAAIVKAILTPASAGADYPAGKVRPSDGRLSWMLTADAALSLPQSPSPR